MKWNNWVRQIHRWMSIAFTVAVIVSFVALAQKPPVVWVFPFDAEGTSGVGGRKAWTANS